LWKGDGEFRYQKKKMGSLCKIDKKSFVSISRHSQKIAADPHSELGGKSLKREVLILGVKSLFAGDPPRRASLSTKESRWIRGGVLIKKLNS